MNHDPKLSAAPAGAGAPDDREHLAPAPPPDRKERVKELADAIRRMPMDDAKETMITNWFLHMDDKLEQSIGLLTDSMLAELENEVTLIERNI